MKPKKVRWLLFVFLFAVFLSARPVCAAGESFRVYFVCDRDTYAVGDTALVQVYLEHVGGSGEYPLYNFSDQVVFSSEQLAYEGAEKTADDFRLDGGPGDAGADYAGVNRFISLRYQYLLPQGVPPMREKKLLAAVLHFRVLREGTFVLLHGGTAVWKSPDGGSGNQVTAESVQISVSGSRLFALEFSDENDVMSSMSDIPGGSTVNLPLCSILKPGKHFVCWYDGCRCYPENTEYRVTKDTAFTALWSGATVIYKAENGGKTAGMYTSGHENFESGTEMDGGTSITLTADPDSGFVFARWNDGSTENPRTLTVCGNLSLSAKFVKLASANHAVPESRVSVFVDGQPYQIGTRLTDGMTAVVTADGKLLSEKLRNAHKTVVIPVSGELRSMTARLSGANLREMAYRQMVLAVTADNARIEMPASAVDMDRIQRKLGAESPEQMTVDITLMLSSGGETDKEPGKTVFGQAELSVVASGEGKEYEVTAFSRYVQCMLELPQDADKGSGVTAVAVKDGKVHHLPTSICQTEGRRYAVVHSLISTKCVLVRNNRVFTDTAGLWFERDAKEMAERNILEGYGDGTFRGDKIITRAEFAAVLVRALGLPDYGCSSAFSDVPEDAWYLGPVGTACQYGLIRGRTPSSFDPQAGLTREEAMTIISRAAVTAGYAGITGSGVQIPDGEDVSTWAEESVRWNVENGIFLGDRTGLLRAHDFMTRAETAASVLRFLQRSGLVNDHAQTMTVLLEC